MFELGSKVKILHLQIHARVLWSNLLETGVLIGRQEAVYVNELLQHAGSSTTNRRKQRSRRRVKTTLALPAIFVDASYRAHKNPSACISAVMTEDQTRISSRHLRYIQAQGINGAEIQAMLFGLKLRPNESWRVYSDSHCAVKNAKHQGATNVIWIPRRENRMADRVVRNGWK